MKKLSRLLVLLLSITFLSACGQSGSESDTVLSDEKEVVENRDFGGEKVVFLTTWVHNFVAETDSPSLQFERLRARIDEVEEKNNFVFDFYGNTLNIPGTVAQMVATGEPIHIIDQEAQTIFGLYKAGLLIPYEEINTMDITDESKFGSYNLRKHGIYDGLSYSFTTFKNWGETPEIDGVIMFDNNQIKEYGMQSPYELYEQGDWKWDKFVEMLELYSFAGNESTPPRYGLNIGTDTLLMKMAILSNGGKILTEKEDGGLEFALNSPEAIEAMEWVASLNAAKHIKADAANISNGNYLFGAFASWIPVAQVVSIRWLPAYTMDDYGILNFPYGPKGEYGSSSAMITNTRRLISLINGDMGIFEPNDIGFIFNQLSEPIYDGDTIITWKDYARTIFHHEEGLVCFEEMFENVSYDYSVQLDTVSSKITNAFTKIFNNRATPVEAINVIADAINLTLTK